MVALPRCLVPLGFILHLEAARVSRKASKDTSPLQWVGGDMSAWALEDGYYAKAGDPAGDPFQQLADSGATAVRLRLWDNPSLFDWNPPGSDMEGMLLSARHAKAAGLDILLCLHYSDTWCDPGSQRKPQAWKNLSVPELANTLRAYTSDVLDRMNAQGTPPALVQVGNEIKHGFLWNEWDEDCSTGGKVKDCDDNWGNVALLLNAGLAGVHDASSTWTARPQTMIHLESGSSVKDTLNFFRRANNAGLNTFDHIGLSYYPRWAGLWASPGNLTRWNEIAAAFPDKGIIMCETDWLSAPLGKDAHPGTNFPKDLFPFTPSGQKQYLQAVLEALAHVPRTKGMFWWGTEILHGYSGGKSGMWDEHGVLLPVASAFAPWKKA